MRNIIEHISNKQVGLVYTKRPPLRLQSTQWNEYFYEIAFGSLYYRHSLIYAVNVGTHKKPAESENQVNQGYLVVLKGRKIG